MSNIFDLFRSIEKKEPQGAPIRIVVGLGNPGPEYALTRHNTGFLALDFIADKLNVKINRSKFHALYDVAEIEGERVLLLKPQTYMNASGQAVRECASFYKIAPDKITVISDDVNLPVGKIRLRRSGSDGGQKGLASIIYQLQDDGFSRIRIGVGAPPSREYDLADWVLGKFPEQDRKILLGEFDLVYETLGLIVKGDFDRAVAHCNSGGAQ